MSIFLPISVSFLFVSDFETSSLVLNIENRDLEVLDIELLLFAYSVEGAEALGIYFTLIQSARAHGIEPERYLTTIFKEIPLYKSIEDYEQLLPWNIRYRLNKKTKNTENKTKRMVA